MIKEMSNKKTYAHVYVKVNHTDKDLKRRMYDAWSNGFNDSYKGTFIKAWMEISEDKPFNVKIADITISSEFKEQKETSILKRRYNDYNNIFLITLTNKKGEKETFEYHISIVETDKGKLNLTPEDKVSALYCILNDAISGQLTYREFLNEYGDSNCQEQYRIWKLCQESYIKITRIIHHDLYELINKISDKYPESV